jgi:hypothetical protein
MRFTKHTVYILSTTGLLLLGSALIMNQAAYAQTAAAQSDEATLTPEEQNLISSVPASGAHRKDVKRVIDSPVYKQALAPVQRTILNTLETRVAAHESANAKALLSTEHTKVLSKLAVEKPAAVSSTVPTANRPKGSAGQQSVQYNQSPAGLPTSPANPFAPGYGVNTAATSPATSGSSSSSSTSSAAAPASSPAATKTNPQSSSTADPYNLQEGELNALYETPAAPAPQKGVIAAAIALPGQAIDLVGDGVKATGRVIAKGLNLVNPLNLLPSKTGTAVAVPDLDARITKETNGTQALNIVLSDLDQNSQLTTNVKSYLEKKFTTGNTESNGAYGSGPYDAIAADIKTLATFSSEEREQIRVAVSHLKDTAIIAYGKGAFVKGHANVSGGGDKANALSLDASSSNLAKNAAKVEAVLGSANHFPIDALNPTHLALAETAHKADPKINMDATSFIQKYEEAAAKAFNDKHNAAWVKNPLKKAWSADQVFTYDKTGYEKLNDIDVPYNNGTVTSIKFGDLPAHTQKDVLHELTVKAQDHFKDGYFVGSANTEALTVLHSLAEQVNAHAFESAKDHLHTTAALGISAAPATVTVSDIKAPTVDISKIQEDTRTQPTDLGEKAKIQAEKGIFYTNDNDKGAYDNSYGKFVAKYVPAEQWTEHGTGVTTWKYIQIDPTYQDNEKSVEFYKLRVLQIGQLAKEDPLLAQAHLVALKAKYEANKSGLLADNLKLNLAGNSATVTGQNYLDGATKAVDVELASADKEKITNSKINKDSVAARQAQLAIVTSAHAEVHTSAKQLDARINEANVHIEKLGDAAASSDHLLLKQAHAEFHALNQSPLAHTQDVHDQKTALIKKMHDQVGQLQDHLHEDDHKQLKAAVTHLETAHNQHVEATANFATAHGGTLMHTEKGIAHSTGPTHTPVVHEPTAQPHVPHVPASV